MAEQEERSAREALTGERGANGHALRESVAMATR